MRTHATTRLFLVIGLMMVGLIGRIVAGSIPTPPLSPFSSFASLVAQTHHEGRTTVASVPLTFAKTGKKQQKHASEGQARPWYGLLDQFADKDPTVDPIGTLSAATARGIPSPDLRTNLRPPSC